MNIMPELDCEQVNLIIDKVVLSFGVNADDVVALQYLQRDWDINYEKIGTSSLHLSFYGTSQKLIDMLKKRKHAEYIKLVGRAEWIDDKPGKVAQSFVWNIPCDMYIEELATSGIMDEISTTELYLEGEMW